MIAQTSHSPSAQSGVPPGWFDVDGFLAQAARWTPALAEQLAAQEGVPVLTAKHWEVIHLVRDRYFSIGALPVMRLICRAVGLQPGKAHHLFSSCKSLWRIAGLPDPGEEAKAYMN